MSEMSGDILQRIQALPGYRQLRQEILSQVNPASVGLPRAARPAVLAALQAELGMPILFITGRASRALTWLDEVGFWAPDLPHHPFPEPAALFYERAVWGAMAQRDRILALTLLAVHHIPGAPKPAQPPHFDCPGAGSDDAHRAAA